MNNDETVGRGKMQKDKEEVRGSLIINEVYADMEGGYGYRMAPGRILNWRLRLE